MKSFWFIRLWKTPNYEKHQTNRQIIYNQTKKAIYNKESIPCTGIFSSYLLICMCIWLNVEKSPNFSPHFLNSFNFPFIFYQFSYHLQQKFLFSSTNSSNMHKGSNELLAKSLKRTFFDLMISVAIHPIQMHKINSFACETMREYFVLKKLLR